MRKKNLLTLIMLMLCLCMIAPSTVNAAPKMKSEKVTLYVGSQKKLKVTGTKKKIKWSSTKKKIATVNSKGKVVAKKAGKTTINAKVDNKVLKCSVTVKDPYLNCEKQTVKIGKTLQLSITGTKAKKWTTSDSKVATVSETGCVMGIKEGSATIKCLGANKKTYKCDITVISSTAPEQSTEKNHEHSYKKTITIKATCTEDGLATYSCTKCKYSYTEPISSTGHKYSIVESGYNCEEPYYVIQECANCGDRFREEKMPTGHTFVTKEIKPTCEEDGESIKTCSNCDYYYSKTIPKTGHTYNKVTVEPTCENGGYSAYVCSNCQKYFEIETIKALGHRWNIGTTIKESTCTEQGVRLFKCPNCGDSYTEAIDLADHTYVLQAVPEALISEATCTSAAYYNYSCELCRALDTTRTGYVGKTADHTYSSEYSVITDSTYSLEGVKARRCLHCSAYTDAIEIPRKEYITSVKEINAFNFIYKTPDNSRYAGAAHLGEEINFSFLQKDNGSFIFASIYYNDKKYAYNGIYANTGDLVVKINDTTYVVPYSDVAEYTAIYENQLYVSLKGLWVILSDLGYKLDGISVSNCYSIV